MRRALGVLLFTFWLTSLLASAQEPANSSPQAADAKSSKATVYIYRYKQFVGSALSPSVFCDGAQLARMDNGRYFTANLNAGKHTFTSNDQQSGIDLELKAGEEYFIRVEIATGAMKGHGRLLLMSREQGSYELKSNKLKPLDAKKVADKDVVSVGEPHLQPTSLESNK
jgi:hypothetical protein